MKKLANYIKDNIYTQDNIQDHTQGYNIDEGLQLTADTEIDYLASFTDDIMKIMFAGYRTRYVKNMKEERAFINSKLEELYADGIPDRQYIIVESSGYDWDSDMKEVYSNLEELKKSLTNTDIEVLPLVDFRRKLARFREAGKSDYKLFKSRNIPIRAIWRNDYLYIDANMAARFIVVNDGSVDEGLQITKDTEIDTTSWVLDDIKALVLDGNDGAKPYMGDFSRYMEDILDKFGMNKPYIYVDDVMIDDGDDEEEIEKRLTKAIKHCNFEYISVDTPERLSHLYKSAGFKKAFSAKSIDKKFGNIYIFLNNTNDAIMIFIGSRLCLIVNHKIDEGIDEGLKITKDTEIDDLYDTPGAYAYFKDGYMTDDERYIKDHKNDVIGYAIIHKMGKPDAPKGVDKDGYHRVVIAKERLGNTVHYFGGFGTDLSGTGVMMANNSYAAKMDFDGEANTKSIADKLHGTKDKMREGSLAEDCMKAFDGKGYLPAIGELALVWENKDKLRKLYDIAETQNIFKYGYLYSSTLRNAKTSAWQINAINGEAWCEERNDAVSALPMMRI